MPNGLSHLQIDPNCQGTWHYDLCKASHQVNKYSFKCFIRFLLNRVAERTNGSGYRGLGT